MLPAPADDCHLFVVDDGGVLFCEGQQELHSLNTTATFVWMALREGAAEETVAAELARHFQVPASESGSAVRVVLQGWDRQGFLAGTQQNRPAVTRPAPLSTRTLPALRPLQSGDGCTRTYVLLDTTFNVRYTEQRQEQLVHPALRHLSANEKSGRSPAGHTADLSIVDLPEGMAVFSGQEPVDFCTDLSGLTPAVKACLLRTALDNYPYLFQIHAGVLEREGECLLLPAAAGSGKTSLTAALVHAGWRYLSDETAPLDAQFRVRPVPMAMAVKSGSWPLLAPLYPGLGDLPVHVREDGVAVRYLPPPQASLAPAGLLSYPVRWIVFPRYNPNANNVLQPLTCLEMLRHLLLECLSLPRRLGQEDVARLIDWIGCIEGFRMEHSGFEPAVRRIQGLAAPHNP